MKFHSWIKLWCLLMLSSGAYAEFFTLGLAGLATFGGFVSYKLRCSFMECCNDEEVPYNIYTLKNSLERKVFGQPMVEEIVPILEAHIKNFRRNTGNKALTISFHGWTGSGKNYVASIIADSLYKKGMSSKFVKMYIGRHHFPSPLRVHEYRETVLKEIRDLVSACPTALIIFDEVNEIPPGVIDVIKPMVDHHQRVDGIDYSGAVFILISNVGGNEITERFIDLNKPREEVQLAEFETTLRKIAFDQGGFKDSSVIYSQLIDHYIPFLPLEERHVKKCTEIEFKEQGYWNPTSKMIDDVLSVVTYGPPDLNLFANAGCKRIKKQVAYVLRKT